MGKWHRIAAGTKGTAWVLRRDWVVKIRLPNGTKMYRAILINREKQGTRAFLDRARARRYNPNRSAAGVAKW